MRIQRLLVLSRLAVGSFAILTALTGCIPLWFPQYKLSSSDGAVSPINNESSYSKLNLDPGNGAKVDVMVDADERGSTAMLVMFHATIPANSHPSIEGETLELVDCSPNPAGPLKLDFVGSQATFDGKILYQWYVNIPGRPALCSFKPPTFIFADQRWNPPTIQAVRRATSPIVINLANLPKH